MAGRVIPPAMTEKRNFSSLPFESVASLLEAVDKPLLVADRSGRLLMANSRARSTIETTGLSDPTALHLFDDILKIEAKEIFSQFENGEHEVELSLEQGDAKSRARVQWLPEPDWLIVQFATQA